MFRCLLLICLVLSGCNHDDENLKGSWSLSCYYSSSNVLSEFKGVYSFSGGNVFKAEFKSCIDDLAPPELIVEYPYSTGEYVTLGSGIEALEVNILINENDSIPALIYITDNQLYFNWGLDNTALEYSIFGYYYLENDAIWGGFPLYEKNDGELYPIFENFLELNEPTTVNFNQYLERN